jgi:hypothetical protein
MSDLIKDKAPVINVHGFPATEQFTSYDQWIEYAQSRLDMVKDRITISDFLKRDQFIRNNRDNNPEPRRVNDMFDDPLPPDGNGVLVGQRRSGWKNSAHPDYRENGFQRREWGFREKVLQGYPDYDPDKIGYGDLDNKVIAGFVTVGDGIFSGIPAYSDILLSKEETRRQIEYGYGRTTGREIVPSGLSFIQDETAAIGIALGSDVRYIWHPRLFNSNLSNPALLTDQMHMGSMSVPKGDYRQFLRVGDFVVIEIGMRMKYWHSLLGGSRPDYWESLIGHAELFDNMPVIGGFRGEDGIKSDVKDVVDSYFLGSDRTYTPDQDSKGLDRRKKSINTPLKTFGQSERFRDTPYHNESKQPIIDHPWSTGTPIPVNSGMPYVMMEEYLIDSTDRFSPSPIVIEPSWIRDIGGNGTNLGSQLRGQLIQLQNVRFVKPLIGKNIWSPAKSPNENPGLYQISGSRFAPDMKEQPRTPQPGNASLGLSIQLAEELERLGYNFLSEVPSSYWTQILGISDREPFENYNGSREIWEHIYTQRYGIDYSGYKFEVPNSSQREDLLPEERVWTTGGPREGVYTLTYDRWSRDQMPFYQPNQRESADGYLYETGLGFGGFDQRRKPGSWPDLTQKTDGSGDVSRENWISQTSRLGLFEYNIVNNLTHNFPASIDTKDGAYWFINEDIPLVNSIAPGPQEAESSWLRSSNKVPAYQGTSRIRTIGDLSRGLNSIADNIYSYQYESNPTLSQLWNGKILRPENGFFMANKTYYVSDFSGVVIPIRINANTEIARFRTRIPQGFVNITGILWQYSLGKPGLEWERESYMMQVWPRFLSDIVGSTQYEVDMGGGVDKEPVTQGGEGGGDTITTLTDVEWDPNQFEVILPLERINELTCDFILRGFGGNPDYPCNSLENNQQQYLIVYSVGNGGFGQWYGIRRIFRFSKDSSGNCTCEGPLPSNTITNP